MRSKRGPLGLLVLTVAFLVFALGPSAALADTGDIVEPQNDPPTPADGFQAGTCISDEPTECSPTTPELFFTEAGGHPQIGFTQYFIQHEPFAPVLPQPPFPAGSLKAPLIEPIDERTIKTLRVDLPVGLTVNPQATDQCTLDEFRNMAGEFQVPACEPSTIVGREEVTLVTNVEGFEIAPGLPAPKGFVIPPSEAMGTKVPIYNLVPKEGEPALFGFVIAGEREIFLEGSVDWAGDYHQGFRIKLPEPSEPFSTLKSRLVNFGKSGDGSYIANPTTCFDPDTGAYTTLFRAESWGEPNPNFPNGSTFWEAGLPPGVEQENCDTVPFEPSLDVKPRSNAVDSPASPEVTVELPFEPNPEGQEQSHVRDASVTLPEGMGLNPSAANTVPVACTNSQFNKGTEEDVECPSASRIGTVEVETQPLPAGSLDGDVYLGQQQGFDPESGNMFRIFINPVSERYGVDVRLIGNVVADKDTGQLTAKLLDNPQVPFESVTLKLDQSKQALTSPPTCSPSDSNSEQEPWARPGTTVNTNTSTFELGKAPIGGCPDTLAERRWGPAFASHPLDNKAGAYRPFGVRLFRHDGDQEVKRIDVSLPPGMTAKLRGLDYCPQHNIDLAGARPGTANEAEPPCPNSSFVGTALIAAGSGGGPVEVPGNVYLAGPYKGAPISLVFITPALAGPFDLGTVVVRVALHVEPETVQVTAVSDPIPDVFGGVKLNIRAINVLLNRKDFTLNPTTCREPLPVNAGIYGGGGNPADPAAWQVAPRVTPFRAGNCKALRFKPKFHARIFGGKNQTRRTRNPKFRAIYDARDGDANLRRAAFILPRATILDQSHIRTICTRVQLAANSCPKASIYGNARATSPLLDKPLRGPVYLTSSDNELPDLLADLRGQINVQLRGVISAKNARLKTVFRKTPDVAVDKFILTMKGGNRGLLVNSRNLCQSRTSGFLNLLAQNSRRERTKNLRLNIPACRG